MIKILGLFLLFAYCAVLASEKRNVQHELCYGEANVTQEEVKEFFTARNFDPNTDNYGFKCFTKCILTQHNVLSDEEFSSKNMFKDSIVRQSDAENGRAPSFTVITEKPEPVPEPEPTPAENTSEVSKISKECVIDLTRYGYDRCEYGFAVYKCLYMERILNSQTNDSFH